MLDLVGVQVLQLDLIVVQQTLEERVGRNRESMLVEGHEGDDVAVGRRRRILTIGHKPLRRIGPPMEKTTRDDSLHACMGNIRAVPRIHGGWRRLWRSKGGGGEAEAIDLGLRRWISKHGRSKWWWQRNGEGKAMVFVCRNMKGEAAIYRMERGEKANRSPRFMRPLRHITSPLSKNRAHPISGHALEGHTG